MANPWPAPSPHSPPRALVTTTTTPGMTTVEQQPKRRKKVLWEYVVEPVQKPTYWDHAALPTEERRARAKRTSLAEQDVCQEDDDDNNVDLSSVEAEQCSDLSSNESVVEANYVGYVAESQISTQPFPAGSQVSEPPQSQIMTQPIPMGTQDSESLPSRISRRRREVVQDPHEWGPLPLPDAIPVYYRCVDRSIHASTIRENHEVLERALSVLYSGFKWGKKNNLSDWNGNRRIRLLSDLGTAECLQVFMPWDNFGRHLWELVSLMSRQLTYNVCFIIIFSFRFHSDDATAQKG